MYIYLVVPFRLSSQEVVHCLCVGMCELGGVMEDGELAVFFRNNHFSTILKRKVLGMALVVRCNAL